jgi:hypothetical protein
MWIFKAKLGPNGVVDKLKVRIVAKGNKQSTGIDFSKTFAPIVRRATIRSIVALVACKCWKLRHLDVTTTFLNGLLTEDIYMIIPPSFPNKGHVYKLVRVLYGLWQAPKAWYTWIDHFFKSLGLKRSNEDPNLYFSIRNNGLYTIVLL